MKKVLCITRGMIIVLFAALVVTGCAKVPPKTEPAPPPPAAAVKSEAEKVIVATVNGVDLNMDSLINMMNRLGPPEGGAKPESLEEHKKRALDKLVLQELAYQQAKAKGLSIGADKIDMAIKNLKENVGGEKEYADYLVKQNVTEAQLRAQVDRSLSIDLDYAKEVLAKVTVPEDVVRAEYERVKNLYILPEKITVVDVWFLKNEGKTSQKKARALLKKIKAGPQQDPWGVILDGTFIVRDLHIQKDKHKELYKAARKLKPGELSGVITMPNELHIIKLEKYSPERQATFDEAKDKLELKFKVPAQEKRTREWERELLKDAKIVLVDFPVQQAQKPEQKTP